MKNKEKKYKDKVLLELVQNIKILSKEEQVENMIDKLTLEFDFIILPTIKKPLELTFIHDSFFEYRKFKMGEEPTTITNDWYMEDEKLENIFINEDTKIMLEVTEKRIKRYLENFTQLHIICDNDFYNTLVKLLTKIEDLEITKMKIIIKDYFKELNTLPVFIDRKFIDINQNME